MHKLLCLFLFAVSLITADAGPLSLQLIPFSDTRYKDRVTAIFKNTSDQTIRILKPMDGSTRSLVYPHYASSVSDQERKIMPLQTGWCALIWFWSNTKWPDDYIVALKPGEIFEMPFLVVHQIPKTGKYIVTLRYEFAPKADEKIFNESYPSNLWIGKVTSNPVTVTLEKN